MSIAIVMLAVVLLAVLNHFWAPESLKKLKLHGCSDKRLVEPGEIVTWTAVVENHSSLPVLFARLWQHFPADAQITGDPKWIESHRTVSFQQWHTEERMSLMPHRQCARSVSFSFEKRGAYSVGNYRLSAGDLLGVSEIGRNGTGHEIVVMPHRSDNAGAIQALGGFLGDISVRRFILEDPILTVGFRDYTGREPMKAISWTRTAMTGSLQVKQYDHTAEQIVVVLLNVEGGTGEILEECFRLTRTVCETLERKKISYAFRTNGNLPGPVGKVFSLAEGLGSTHLSTVLYGLGKADDTCFQSFRYLVRQTLNQRKNHEAYIVITPPLNEEGRSAVRQLEGAIGSGVCMLTAEAREVRE